MSKAQRVRGSYEHLSRSSEGSARLKVAAHLEFSNKSRCAILQDFRSSRIFFLASKKGIEPGSGLVLCRDVRSLVQISCAWSSAQNGNRIDKIAL